MECFYLIGYKSFLLWATSIVDLSQMTFISYEMKNDEDPKALKQLCILLQDTKKRQHDGGRIWELNIRLPKGKGKYLRDLPTSGFLCQKATASKSETGFAITIGANKELVIDVVDIKAHITSYLPCS